MLETGWIFPDGTEDQCGVCYCSSHEQEVFQFIRGLKFQNPEIKKIIEKEIDELYWKKGSDNLYSIYAIQRLGWIKVGTSILQEIKYAGYDWQIDLIKPYEEKGYKLVNMCFSSSEFLPLSCNILKAIREGR